MEITFYKIFQKDKPENFYIGSTSNFSGRKSRHKKNTTNKKSVAYWTKLYKFIRDNGGWDKFECIPLYKSICSDKEDRKQEEQCLMMIANPPLNKYQVVKSDIIENFNYLQKIEKIKKILEK